MRRRGLYFILIVLVLALGSMFAVFKTSEGYNLQPDIQPVIQPTTVCFPDEPEGELACSDTQDNDCDGDIDCADSDCSESNFCVTPELESVVPGNVHPEQPTPVYLFGDNFNVNSRVSVGNVYFPLSGTHFISSQMLIVEAVTGAPPGDYEVFVSNNVNDPNMESSTSMATFVDPVNYAISSCDVCSTLSILGCNRNSCEGVGVGSCYFETTNFETLEGTCELCDADTVCSDYGDDALSCIRNECNVAGGCGFADGVCVDSSMPGLTTQGTCSGDPMPSCIPFGVCSDTRPSCVNGNWNCDFALNSNLEVFVETSCSDGLDNDCDNKLDCADSDCSNTQACDSTAPPGPNPPNGGGGDPDPECSNDEDDDGDGLIDLDDPGCSRSSDNSEDSDNGQVYIPTVAACADGLDNDVDGLIDLNDPGCSSSSDNSEINFVAVADDPDTIVLDDDSDSSGGKLWFWIVIGILGLLIVVVILMVIVSLRKGKEPEVKNKLVTKKAGFSDPVMRSQVRVRK